MDDKELAKMAETVETVVYSLSALGYPNPISVPELTELVTDINSFTQYSECIAWLATELRTQCKLDECVNPVSGPDDFDSFRMELNSFLRELHCPYPLLRDYGSGGDHNASFHRLELSNFLCTELQAVRVSKRVKREVSTDSTAASPSTILETTADVLGVKDRLSDNGSALDILKAVIDEVKDRLGTGTDSILNEPLLSEDANGNQWAAIESINDQMKVDYQHRADMLLKRLDVTIQSFTWSDRLKGRKQEIMKIFTPLRQQLRSQSPVSMAELLAARKDLTFFEKKAVSSDPDSRTQSKLQKIMLTVGPPDRGGRPKDVTRMPQWKERIVSGGGGPERERHHRKKKNEKGKRKPWKDDEAASGPSGSVTMTKKSRKKSKKGDHKEGTEVADASELVD